VSRSVYPISLLLILFLFHLPLWGAIKPQSLVDQLAALQRQVVSLEQNLLEGLQSQKNTTLQVRKIQKLLQLQKLERSLGHQRISELEKTVVELESRKAVLNERMIIQQKAIRRFLMAIEMSSRSESANHVRTFHLPEHERWEAPRRKVLSNLVDRGLKEIEVLRVDLADAAQLEAKIQEEKHQLAYLFQDLKEQESVLEFNRQLQVDVLKRKQNERVTQLENYRKLKSAEAQVERLIGEFNARRELEHAAETERLVTRAMLQGEFSKLKGKLPFPVLGGRVISTFGKSFDPRSGLYIFKKGVDIESVKKEPVRAISSGKVAFSGELPNYGQVVIIDHGEHFYSLCAHLGGISKKTNETVAAGDQIGLTDDSGTPLYFEIRARNVAVNPLQWVFN
jgi:septal ring factor EnvC (AmiA/AmiB activator)